MVHPESMMAVLEPPFLQPKLHGGNPMRHTILALTIGLAALVLTNEPTIAETCTGYYQQCRQKCATARKAGLCLNECSTSKLRCMKTGTWIGRSTKDTNVVKQ